MHYHLGGVPVGLGSDSFACYVAGWIKVFDRGATMPYAEGRVFNDADSHIMETFDWLLSYADPKFRDRIRPMSVQMAGGKATADLGGALPGIIARRKRDPEAMARAEAKILERKSWHALGGFDPDERRRALDLLG